MNRTRDIWRPVGNDARIMI